eukprot:3501177-Ditylum_brightwellii.AAC.1
MVIVKPYQRKKDGRSTYTALYYYYLGTNTINDLVTAMEADLDLQKYKGETRRADFETYVTHQNKCRNVLNDLTRFGYSGMGERSKIRILSKNIETKTVDTVKAQILGDPKMQKKQ